MRRSTARDRARRGRARLGVRYRRAMMARKSERQLKQVMHAAHDRGFLEDEPLRRRIPLPSATKDKPGAWGNREVPEALPKLEGRSICCPDSVSWRSWTSGGRRPWQSRAPTLTCRDSMLIDGSDALTAFVRVAGAFTCKDGLKHTQKPPERADCGGWRAVQLGLRWTALFSEGERSRGCLASG